MSNAKVEYKRVIFEPKIQWMRKIVNEYVSELEQTLDDARIYIQNLYDNTDPCTCPAEGDCVCGQSEMLNIINKIDEVI